MLPLDADIAFLEARQLELETGIDRLRLKLSQTPVDVPNITQTVSGKTSLKPTLPQRKETIVGNAEPRPVVDEADNKKVQKLVSEEREKRRMAEAMLRSQREAMIEIQQQLSQLQEREAANLTLRQGLTISRLEPAVKASLHSESLTAGKDSFGFQSKIQESPAIISVPGSLAILETRLVAAVNCGSVRLPVENQEGVRKGMICLVGSGSRCEITKIASLGSIIIATPLRLDHALGTIIRVYSSDSKAQASVKSIIARELIREIVLDDVVNAAVNAKANESPKGFRVQGVDAENITDIAYFVEIQPTISIPHLLTSIAACNHLKGEFAGVCDGEIMVFDASLGAIDLIVLFLDSCEDRIGGETASIDTIFGKNRREPYLCNLIRRLRGSESLNSLEDEIRAHSSGVSISWSSFLNFLKGKKSAPVKKKFNSTQHVLLSRLFDILDWGGEQQLSILITARVFAELDGAMVNSELFLRSIEILFGARREDVTELRLGLLDFIALREEYASSQSTVTGGMRLYGRQIIQSCYSSSMTTQIPVESLLGRLPSAVLDAVYLPSGSTLRSLLSADPHAHFVDVKPMLGIPCGTSISSVCHTVNPGSDMIHQVLFSPLGSHMYSLLKSGVLQVHDSFTGELLCRQRIIWAEPKPRKLEGSETFLKWLAETDFINDGKATIEYASTSLSEFILGAENLDILAVDSSNGLLLVNNSINCNAIAFLDPMSLRRIHRFPSPSKLSSELNDAVSDIFNGARHRVIASYHGAVSKLVLISSQRILVCTVIGIPNIYVLSLMSGNIITQLQGHRDDVSCIHFCANLYLLLSGSADSTVRLWNMLDTLPEHEALHGLLTDTDTLNLERKITNRRETDISENVLLKEFGQKLASALGVSPRMMRCEVIGFLDAKGLNPVFSSGTKAVELCFENGMVKTVSNIGLLRRFSTDLAVNISFGEMVELFCVNPLGVARAFSVLCSVDLQGDISRPRFEASVHKLLPSEDNAYISRAVDCVFRGSKIILVKSVFLRLFQYEDKFSNKCQGLLSGHHVGKVIDVAHCSASGLVVSLDHVGVCCVWDIDGLRRLSHVTADYNVNSLISLVGKKYINVDPKRIVKGLLQYSNQPDKRIFVSANREQIAKAVSIDTKFIGNKCVRGFIYVYNSQDAEVIETTSFIPSMVTLDHTAFKNEELLPTANTVLKKMEYIVRIIYVASAAHNAMRAIIDDLRIIGVLGGKIDRSPSELVHFVCFEVSGSSFDRPFAPVENGPTHRQAVSNPTTVSQNEVPTRSSSPHTDESPYWRLTTHNSDASLPNPGPYTGRATDSGGLCLGTDDIDVIYVHTTSVDGKISDALIPVTIWRGNLFSKDQSRKGVLSYEDIDQTKSLISSQLMAIEGKRAAIKLLNLSRTAMSAALADVRGNAVQLSLTTAPPRSVLSVFKGSFAAKMNDLAIFLDMITAKASFNHPLVKHFQESFLLNEGRMIAAADVTMEKWLRSDLISFNDVCALSKHLGVDDVGVFEIYARRSFGRDNLSGISLDEFGQLSRERKAVPKAILPSNTSADIQLSSPLQAMVLLNSHWTGSREAAPSSTVVDLSQLSVALKLSNRVVHAYGFVQATNKQFTLPASEPTIVTASLRSLTVESIEPLDFHFRGMTMEKLLFSSENSGKSSWLFLRCDDTCKDKLRDTLQKVRRLGLDHVMLTESTNLQIRNFNSEEGLILSLPESMVQLSTIISGGGIMPSKDRAALFCHVITQIYLVVCELEDKGVKCTGLSPSSVFIDFKTSTVKIVPSTLFVTGDESLDGPSIRAYVDCVKMSPSTFACVPPTDKLELLMDKWLTWSFGAILYEIVFGSPFVYDENLKADIDHVFLHSCVGSLNSLSRVEGWSKAPTSIDISNILRILTGESLKELSRFRDSFVSVGLSSGLVLSSVICAWDKIVQSLYVNMVDQRSSEALTTLFGMPTNFDEAGVTEYFSSALGVEFSQQEMNIFLSCAVSDDKYYPIADRYFRAMNGLKACLTDALFYGGFQQILYVLTQTLNTNPSQKSELRALRNLRMFQCMFHSTEGGQNITDFTSSRAFVETRLLLSLKDCILSLLGIPRINVHKFSTLLIEIENVLRYVNRKVGILEDRGEDEDRSWLSHNCEEVLSQLCDAFILETIASCVVLCSRRSDMGADLFARVLSFLKFSASVYSDSSTRIDNAIKNEPSLDRMPRLLAMKCTIERFLQSLLSSVIMLYFGEEVPLATFGDYAQTFNEAFPDLKLHSNHLIRPENEFESTIYNASEAILLELLGENGSGSRKLKGVVDQISQMNSLVELFKTRK